MDSTLVSGRKKPMVFYGWWVVAAAWFALTIESGMVFYGFGIYLKAFTDYFGWSRAETAAAVSIYWLTQAFLSPLIGGLVDRYGARRLMSVGTLILGISFLFLSRIDSVWQLYAGYVLVGIGATTMSLVPAGTAVSNWFRRRRGRMIGMTFTGLGFGGMIVPPTLNYLIASYGWQASFVVAAAVLLLGVLPVVALVIRTRPEEKGLLPDGEEVPAGMAVEKKDTREAIADTADRAAVNKYATLAFWLISIGFLVASLGTLAISAHQYAFLTDLGWSSQTAALAISLTGFLSVVGKLFFGTLSDRISPCYAAIACFALQGIGSIIVLSFKLDPIVWLFVTMYGLGMGGTPALRPLVTAEVFGMKGFGAVFGLITGISTIGSVIGPLFAGFVFDASGKYDLAFLIFAVTFAIAIGSLGMLRLRPPKPAVQLQRP